MNKVSVIIPARFEQSEAVEGKTVLWKTIEDVLAKASGDIEVLVGMDGAPFQELPNDKRITVFYTDNPRGIKNNLNYLAMAASGKYLFKLDAHCSVAPGFDEDLQRDMQDNWLVMPRFYVLDERTWRWQDDRFYDYFYLCCPFTDPRGFRFKAGGHWPERTKEKLDIPIDETPQIHGSGWFCTKDFYCNKLGGFQFLEEDPMGHAQEPPYLGLKTWLGPWDGKVMVNKKTWYAHMHKGKQHDRGFRYTHDENERSYQLIANYFMGDKWEGRKHNIDWFIERFMPMPTWPDNWRELLSKYQQK